MKKYWHTEDKQWIAERKRLWKRIKNRLIMGGGDIPSTSELSTYESYIVYGDFVQMDEIGEYCDIKLVYLLAWHPSDDIEVWLELFRMHQVIFEKNIDESYREIDQALYISGEIKDDAVNDLFLNRASLIYEFFIYRVTSGDNVSKNIIELSEHRLSLLVRAALTLPSFLFSVPLEKRVFNCFTHQVLPHLAELSNLETVLGVLKEGRYLNYEKAFKVTYQLYRHKNQLSDKLRETVTAWVTQIESENTHPKWKRLWNKAKTAPTDRKLLFLFNKRIKLEYRVATKLTIGDIYGHSD